MDKKPATKKGLESIMKKGLPTKLLMGVGSGWCAGMITTRMGKLPTALLGTSIIAFQLAQIQDYTKMSWKDVGAQAETHKPLQDVKGYLKENPDFAAGFAGGYLIGLTC